MHIFNRIHPSVPALIFCISIIIGDVAALILRTKFFGSFLWAILAVVLFILSILFSRRLTIIFAVLAGLIIPMHRIAPTISAGDYYQNLIGQNIVVKGKIAKDPSESSSGKYNVVLSNIEISTYSNGSESYQSIPGKSEIFVSLSSLKISDEITLRRSDIVELEGAFTEGFGSYSGTILRPKIKSTSRPNPGDLFLDFRDFFADKIKDYIPSPESGLGLGYLLGQKSGVDKTFQDALRIVGLTHIVVASGAHLGTLTSASKKIFGKLSRFAGAMFSALTTIIFICITGLSASMIRAGLVTFLSLIAKYFGREIKPLNLIIFVAAVTLIYNPNYLADLAWLLSFGSFTGILVVAPKITDFFYGKSRKPNFVFNTLITSFSAALICTPILLFFFGQFSIISVIANLLILPTVSIAMGLTFATGLSAIIIPPIAAILGKLATILLDYQISVVNFFSEQKIFLVEIEPGNPAVLAFYIPLVLVFLIPACYAKCKPLFLPMKPKNKI